jgi:hypothetical protein
MATQLSIVNRILRRLREDQVTTIVDNEYAILLAEFVGDAYEDTSEEHDWPSLSHEIIVDFVATQSVYTISSTVATGGDVRTAGNTRTCTADSQLEYFDDEPNIQIYNDAADGNGWPPTILTREEFAIWKSRDRLLTNADPCIVTIYPAEDNQSLLLEVYPEPTEARELHARFVTEPGELALDGTDDATVIIVPDRPVYQLALMYAYLERGEELGEPGGIAERRWVKSLSAAKEQAIKLRERANFYDWRRD